MLLTLIPGDGVFITIHGTTHHFQFDLVKINVEESTTKDGRTCRYLVAIINLHDEFPEDVSHVTSGAAG